MRTETDIQQDLRKLYAERAKIRKTVYAEYVGKCYLVNGVYYFIESVLDRGFKTVIINDDGISLETSDLMVEQLQEFVIPKEQFIQELEKRVDLIIKQVKGEK